MAFSHKSKEHPEVEGTHKDQLFPLHRTPPRIPPCVPLLTRSKEQVLPLSHHHLPSAPQSLPHPLAQPQVVTLQISGPSPRTAAPQAPPGAPSAGMESPVLPQQGESGGSPFPAPFSPLLFPLPPSPRVTISRRDDPAVLARSLGGETWGLCLTPALQGQGVPQKPPLLPQP